MKIPVVLIFLSSFWHYQLLADGFSRQKRYLLYSLHGSKLQLIFGTGLPIHINEISATIGWVIKSAYLLPTNASIYTDPYSILENKRSIDKRGVNRYDLYRTFEKKLLSFHSAGSDCLLKAICEASVVPFRGAGLLGKLLSVFFLPSTTEELPETAEDRAYYSAENHAADKEPHHCNIRYPACDLQLVDLLTVVL